MTGCVDDLPAQFEYLEEGFSYVIREVQFQKLCTSVTIHRKKKDGTAVHFTTIPHEPN